jgi:hypothetical protein
MATGLPTMNMQRTGGAMANGAEHHVPPPAAMMGLITGYWVSQAVGVVAQLGVADHLNHGPRSSDELAQAVGAEPQALYRVLRLLTSLGVFEEVTPRTFRPTRCGTSRLPRPHPDTGFHGDGCSTASGPGGP